MKQAGRESSCDFYIHGLPTKEGREGGFRINVSFRECFVSPIRALTLESVTIGECSNSLSLWTTFKLQASLRKTLNSQKTLQITTAYLSLHQASLTQALALWQRPAKLRAGQFLPPSSSCCESSHLCHQGNSESDGWHRVLTSTLSTARGFPCLRFP